jgi:restriction system protein
VYRRRYEANKLSISHLAYILTRATTPRRRSSIKGKYYKIEVRHEGLNKYRTIKHNDFHIAQEMAEDQKRKWDAEWRQKITSIKNKKELAAIQTKEIEQSLTGLMSLLSEALSTTPCIDWKELKDRTPFSNPKPTIPTYISIPLEPAPTDIRYKPKITWLDKIFRSRRLKKEKAAKERFRSDFEKWLIEKNEIEKMNNAAEAEYQKRLTHWQIEHEKWKSDQSIQHEEVEALRRDYLKHKRGAVISYCEFLLTRSQYPEWFSKDFDLDYYPASKTIVVDYSFPAVKSFPAVSAIRYDAASDEFKSIPIKEHVINRYYDSLIYQITLRTIHELFEADIAKAIDTVVFNAWVTKSSAVFCRSDLACIISIQCQKQEFSKLNVRSLILRGMDPKAIFKKLTGREISNPHEMVEVAPAITINHESERNERNFDEFFAESTEFAKKPEIKLELVESDASETSEHTQRVHVAYQADFSDGINKSDKFITETESVDANNQDCSVEISLFPAEESGSLRIPERGAQIADPYTLQTGTVEQFATAKDEKFATHEYWKDDWNIIVGGRCSNEAREKPSAEHFTKATDPDVVDRSTATGTTKLQTEDWIDETKTMLEPQSIRSVESNQAIQENIDFSRIETTRAEPDKPKALAILQPSDDSDKICTIEISKTTSENVQSVPIPARDFETSNSIDSVASRIGSHTTEDDSFGLKLIGENSGAKDLVTAATSKLGPLPNEERFRTANSILDETTALDNYYWQTVCKKTRRYSNPDRQFFESAKLFESYTVSNAKRVPTTFLSPDCLSYATLFFNENLPWYFYWRNEVRNGRYHNTDTSCIFLYAFELIHNIGVLNSQRGYDQLHSLWMAYRCDHETLDRYLPEWIVDYAKINKLDIDDFEFLRKCYVMGCSDIDPNIIVHHLLEKKPINLSIPLLDKFISYSITYSRFYQNGYKELMDRFLPRVISNIDIAMRDRTGKGIFESFEPRKRDGSKKSDFRNRREPFIGAIYFNPNNYRIDLNYGCYSRLKSLRSFLTSVVKYTENRLRRLHRFGGNLQVGDINKDAKEIIDHLLDSYSKKLKNNFSKTHIELDLSKISQISAQSEEIRIILSSDPNIDGGDTKDIACVQDDLMAQEKTITFCYHGKKEIESEKMLDAADQSNLTLNEFIKSCSNIDFLILESISRGNNVSNTLIELTKKSGLMPESEIDRINELAMEMIGDLIIEPGDPPSIYDENKDIVEQILTMKESKIG